MPRHHTAAVVTPFGYFGISYFKKHSFSSNRQVKIVKQNMVRKGITNVYSIYCIAHDIVLYIWKGICCSYVCVYMCIDVYVFVCMAAKVVYASQ